MIANTPIQKLAPLLENHTDRETPFLLIDSNRLRATCQTFLRAFSGDEVYFSMKANSTPEVLEIIAQEGIRFDAASYAEIDKLRRMHIPAEKIIFMAPTKIPADIERAYAAGVRVFSFDSAIELQKLASLAPGARVMCRVAVGNEGSEWPLERKFGASALEAAALLAKAAQLGLKPLGLTFHVGSQNRNPRAWRAAIEQCAQIWYVLADQGIQLEAIDAGGGFPSNYGKDYPAVEEIAAVIHQALAQLLPPGARLMVEPGRGLVAECGVLVTSVINRAHRAGQEWLYIDASTYHGLVEAMQGFTFPIRTEKDFAPRAPFVLCGPTCDSTDVIQENVLLPATLGLGDRLYLLTTGAYTTSMEHYNGFKFPPTSIE